MIVNKGPQTEKRFYFAHIFKNKLIFWGVVIFCSGCSQLPLSIGVESGKIDDGLSEEEAANGSKGNETRQKATEEDETNPFDLNLSDEDLRQSELDSALRRLVKDLEQAMMSANEGVASNSDGTYVVKRGDYLDKIIRTTVGNYPFKRDILRKAFVQANPKVFRRSNPNWMYANKKMQIPQVEDIKRVIFKDQSEQRSSLENPYEGWVRYP